MTNMRTAHWRLGLAALVAASVSCGDVVRQGRSPMYLVIDTLQAAKSPGTTFSTFLLSDVIFNVTTGGTCTTVNPCPTFFNDVGQVTLRLVPKDVTGVAPTTNNDVTITSYHVNYRRTDRVNGGAPGVDVPYPFDGAVTVTVPAGGVATISFEIVRSVAKEEPPLVQLINSAQVITTLADVTFYGKDRVGNDVTVMGTIQIDFGNFGDS
jgi:hypothetical protein